MDFEIFVDDSLVALGLTNGVQPFENKHLLSLTNDFEDGAWRQAKFDDFIWDNISQTALNASEREALIDRHGSALRDAAKKLRMADSANDQTEGSELAEIFLYGVMRHHFGALSVVPKIYHKQNANDNAKGADSVHIIVKGDGFTLWFGEAKFYSSIENSRLSAVVKSIERALDKDKLKKENSIVTGLSDLNDLGFDDTVVKSIKDALAPNVSIDKIKPLINIPVLILHQCELLSEHQELTDEYKKALIAHHTERAQSYFAKQCKLASKLHKYVDIKFHLILFPVPNKQEIVDRFLSAARFHRGE